MSVTRARLLGPVYSGKDFSDITICEFGPLDDLTGDFRETAWRRHFSTTLTSKTEFPADSSIRTLFAIPECLIKDCAFGNQRTYQKSQYHRQLLVIPVFYKTNFKFGGRNLQHNVEHGLLAFLKLFVYSFLYALLGLCILTLMTALKVGPVCLLKVTFRFNRVLLLYNFLEPLHFLEQGYGFQTWELSPKFVLRSRTYIYCITFLLRLAIKCVPYFTIRNSFWTEFGQRAAFFAICIFLATISVLVEAMFYRNIVDKINECIGRHYFFMMFFSAGIWSASTC